jgi:hypothetical protein
MVLFTMTLVLYQPNDTVVLIGDSHTPDPGLGDSQTSMTHLLARLVHQL